MSGKQQTRKNIAAAVNALKALQMRQLGHTYDRIAEQCGYSNRGAAFHAVQRELKRTITPVAEDVRCLELTRLDQLLTVFYAKALKGDGWSMDRVLRIMERRASFLGLDAPRDVKVSGAIEHSLVPRGQVRALATDLLEAVRDMPAAREALSIRLLASGE